MVLMVILLNILPVSEAMVVHGLVQLISTGSRIALYSKSLRQEIILKYILGVLLTLVIFKMINFYPNKAMIYLMLGLMPFIGFTRHVGHRISITKPGRSFVCGMLITAVQLSAGVAGPILDIFFLNAPLNRYEILATKALTQALGHIVKVYFYGMILFQSGQNISLPSWSIPVIVVLTLLGNFLGSKIVARINDQAFKKVSRYFIYLITIPLLIKGIRMLY